MKITFRLDDDLVAKARAYAQSHSTTLNQLIRDYLGRVTGQLDPAAAAAQFVDVARRCAGRSDDGQPVNRAVLHARPGKVQP
jgi:hypothetical protein